MYDIGQPISTAETFTLYEYSSAGQTFRKCGKLAVRAMKGVRNFEFKIVNANRLRTNTAVSQPQAVLYAQVTWNGRDLGSTPFTQEEQDASWVHIKEAVFCTDTYPFDIITDCTVEIQLWTQVPEKEIKTAVIVKEFIGAMHLNGAELFDLFCSDPFYRRTVTKKLQSTVNIPRDQRAKLFSGAGFAGDRMLTHTEPARHIIL